MKVRARIEWKLADLWVGAFWKVDRNWHETVRYDGPREDGTAVAFVTRNATVRVDVWVCLVPCLPLHLTFTRHRRLWTAMRQVLPFDLKLTQLAVSRKKPEYLADRILPVGWEGHTRKDPTVADL